MDQKKVPQKAIHELTKIWYPGVFFPRENFFLNNVLSKKLYLGSPIIYRIKKYYSRFSFQ
jgi:hypothetical protein